MTDISMKYDFDLHLDRAVHTDLTAFHRLDNLTTTQTDKKENKSFPRFAFLKISANPLAAHLKAAQATAKTKAFKRAAILPTLKVYLNIFVLLLNNLLLQTNLK